MNNFLLRLTVFVILPGLFFTVACTKNHGENNPVSASLTSHSDCKNSKKNQQVSTPADTLSCVEYRYDPVEKILKISHLNAGFNCCPGELDCKADIQNRELIITESEEEAGCNCMCLFDLEIEITDLEPGIYTLRMAEPYIGQQALLKDTLDLNAAPSGSFCVVRKDYPYGASLWR